MKHEDLIQKLENLETPEIELPGHKQALKMALLGSGRFRERTIMDWAKILAPISAAVLLIAVVGFFSVIQPQLQIARAKGIVMNDLLVQELMEDYELAITEVKLRNGEAFVLLAPELKTESGRGMLLNLDLLNLPLERQRYRLPLQGNWFLDISSRLTSWRKK